MYMMLGSFLDIINGLFSIIPKLLYFIVACVLSLIDLFQVAFRKLAGLDPIIVSGETMRGDVVYQLIIDALFNDKYPAIRTVFWSLIILGVFMLIITSLIALIRLEYNPDKEKGNSKSGVVKNFFKAIFSFAIVPIACLFGMYLFNALVGVVDSATTMSSTQSAQVVSTYDKWSAATDSNQNSFAYGSTTLTPREDSYMAYEIFGVYIPTTSQPFSGIVFRACAYGSNRMRNDEDYFKVLKDANSLNIIGSYNDKNSAAEIIDVGFSINAKLKGTYNLDREITKEYFSDFIEFNIGKWSYKGITSLSKYNVNAVFYFYDLWSFNYVVAFVAMISIGKSYYTFMLYLMQRLFEILGLFLVSPISVSLMPLDNGDSLKSWRTLFVTKFVLLVIMVGTLNLVTPLVSICQNIQFFGIPVLDYILLTFFLIAALNAVDSLNKMFSKIFTGDDKNFGQVGEAGDKITGNFQTGLQKTMAGARLAAKTFTLPAKAIGFAGGIGVRSAMENRRQRIARRLDDQERNADTQYDRGLDDLNNRESQISSQEDMLSSEREAIEQDNATLNQFNNQTGGFIERNEQNDQKMLEAYRRSHLAGKKKTDPEYQAYLENLKNDEYRKKILEEQYAKDDEKRFNSFYQDDMNLSKAENLANRQKTFEMLQKGESGIAERRSGNDASKAKIATERAKFETEREAEIQRLAKVRDDEKRRIQRQREKPERTARILGSAAKAAGKEVKSTSADMGTVVSSIPGAGDISSSIKTITHNDKK